MLGGQGKHRTATIRIKAAGRTNAGGERKRWPVIPPELSKESEAGLPTTMREIIGDPATFR